MSVFNRNFILMVDSYKSSHFLQYPPEVTNVYSYIEPRKGGVYNKVLFVGLQAFIMEWLTTPITMEDVNEAEELLTLHGVVFNRPGWERIVNVHGGYMPIEIKAIPEGLVIPTGNVLVTVVNTDPLLPWLAQYIETALLRAVWYPSTVGTVSWNIKQEMKTYFDKTSDDPSGLAFKLHDFGARGVSSAESAALGSLGHLVNFMGTDTVEALVLARKAYFEKMAGFSVNAAEHSTITAWGKNRELDAYKNMLKHFAKPGSIVAVVSDSYDLDNAVVMWNTDLRQQVIDSGAVVVIRPDSGDPVETPLRTIERLGAGYGFTVNSKGFKVLNNVRVIQGDGMNPDSIHRLLWNLDFHGWSIDNIAVGMGGGLLQQVNRDTERFAQKASAACSDGVWFDVRKEPKTDMTKASKGGKLSLITEDGEYSTVPQKDNYWRDVLQVRYKDGEHKNHTTFAKVRENSNR